MPIKSMNYITFNKGKPGCSRLVCNRMPIILPAGNNVMAINLLMWNIQFFTNSRIDIETPVFGIKESISGYPIPYYNYRYLHLEYILNNISHSGQILNKPLNVFVLIENLCSRGIKGGIADGEGAVGARSLLEKIRERRGRNWMMVPPIKLVDELQIQMFEEEVGSEKTTFYQLIKQGAYTECISVFYDSNVLDFIGPYVWPLEKTTDTLVKIAVPDGKDVETGPYPEPWNSAYIPSHIGNQTKYYLISPNPQPPCRRI
jgi:hypothetical protein